MHFKKIQKTLFVNNFIALKLWLLKFLKQKETMVTQISAALSIIRVMLKNKCLLFSNFSNFPCKIVKFKLEVVGVGILGAKFYFQSSH